MKWDTRVLEQKPAMSLLRQIGMPTLFHTYISLALDGEDMFRLSLALSQGKIYDHP
jgi:hypothetical protein